MNLYLVDYGCAAAYIHAPSLHNTETDGKEFFDYKTGREWCVEPFSEEGLTMFRGGAERTYCDALFTTGYDLWFFPLHFMSRYYLSINYWLMLSIIAFYYT